MCVEDLPTGGRNKQVDAFYQKHQLSEITCLRESCLNVSSRRIWSIFLSAVFSYFLTAVKSELQRVHLRPLRSATAPAACFSAPLGSGTVDPTGKLSHSEGQSWPGLRKAKYIKRSSKAWTTLQKPSVSVTIFIVVLHWSSCHSKAMKTYQFKTNHHSWYFVFVNVHLLEVYSVENCHWLPPLHNFI